MRKFVSVMLDLSFTLLIFCSIGAPEWISGRSWVSIVIGFLVIRVAVLMWPMFSKRPLIEIVDDRVILDGMSFDRDNIRSARVFGARIDGKMERYLEVAFVKKPAVPIWFRARRFFMDSAFPLRCAEGIPLARKPRIIVPIDTTTLSDEGIRVALSKIKLQR